MRMMMLKLPVVSLLLLLLPLSCIFLLSSFDSLITKVVAIKRISTISLLSPKKFVAISSSSSLSLSSSSSSSSELLLSNNYLLRIRRGGDGRQTSVIHDNDNNNNNDRDILVDDNNDSIDKERNPIDSRSNMSTNNSTTTTVISSNSTKKKDVDGSKAILSKALLQNKNRKFKLLFVFSKNIRQTIQLSKNSIGYKLIRPIRTKFLLLFILLLLYKNQLLLLLIQLISEPVYDNTNLGINKQIIVGRSISIKSLLKATILIDLFRRCTVILLNILVINYYKHQNSIKKKNQQKEDDNIVDDDNSIESLSLLTTNTTKAQNTTTTSNNNNKDIVENQSTTSTSPSSLLYTFLTKSPLLSLLLILLLGMFTSTSDGDSNFSSTSNILLRTISIIIRTFVQTITSTGVSSSGIVSIVLFVIQLYSSSTIRNPAYIPSIEQHYTFEQINERYIKDDYAYQKVISISNSKPSNNISELLCNNQSLQLNNTLTTSTNSVEKISSRKYVPLSQLLLQKILLLFNNQQQSIVSSTSSSLSAVGFVPTRPKDISSYNGTVVIMDWTDLDTSVSTQNILRDKVSFIIHQYNKYYKQSSSSNINDNCDNNNNIVNKDFEVIVLLESSGGNVADYALASSHLLRLRNVGIVVTVCVDKVAASGGYMIACTASPNQLYGSTFAIFGSIGVIGQTINIQNLLNKYGIKSIIIKGGKNKAPLGMFGDVTNDNIQNVQSMINIIHTEFKNYITDHRPILQSTIEDVCTGDIWLGCNAIHNKLIDRVITSDEYITERVYTDNARVVKLVQILQPKYPSIFSKPIIVQSSSSTSSLLSSTSSSSSQQQHFQQQYNNNQQMIPMALSQHEHQQQQQSKSLVVPSYYFMKSYFGTIISDIRSLIVQKFL